MRVDRVASVDRGFVPRGPRELYGRVADVRSYGGWWPGASVRADAGGTSLSLPVIGTATATTERQREGTGVFVTLDGPSFGGTIEWYLEPFKDGTIVHAIVDGEARERWTARRVRRLRGAIRSALVALRREA